MRRCLLWIVFAALTAAAMAIAPNALWLSRSSAIVHNTGSEALTLRVAIFDDPERTVEIGELAPGASRFLWLDPMAEATLHVEAKTPEDWARHCTEYVEPSMYRVEIVVRAPQDITCETDLPLFDRLLLADLLR